MLFYVYILESESNGSWYYGFTEDIDQRIRDHQSNRSKYTRFKGPWKLIFKRTFSDKKEALRFERYLKSTRNKEFIKQKFTDYFITQ